MEALHLAGAGLAHIIWVPSEKGVVFPWLKNLPDANHPILDSYVMSLKSLSLMIIYPIYCNSVIQIKSPKAHRWVNWTITYLLMVKWPFNPIESEKNITCGTPPWHHVGFGCHEAHEPWCNWAKQLLTGFSFEKLPLATSKKMESSIDIVISTIFIN